MVAPALLLLRAADTNYAETQTAGTPRPEGLEHMEHFFGMPEKPTGKCQNCKATTPLWCATCRWWVCFCFAGKISGDSAEGCRMECPCGTAMQYVELQAALKRRDPFREYRVNSAPQWVRAPTYTRICGRALSRWKADRQRLTTIYCFLDSLKVHQPAAEELPWMQVKRSSRSDLGEALANLQWLTEAVRGLWEAEQSEERGELKREVEEGGVERGGQDDRGKRSRSR